MSMEGKMYNVRCNTTMIRGQTDTKVN